MKPTAPCKDCKPPTRYLGCHDRCEIYQQFVKDKYEYNLRLAEIKGANVYFEEKARKKKGQK